MSKLSSDLVLTTTKIELVLAALIASIYSIYCLLFLTSAFTDGLFLFLLPAVPFLLILQVIGVVVIHSDRRSNNARKQYFRDYLISLLAIPMVFLGVYSFENLGLAAMWSATAGLYPTAVFMRIYLKTSP